MFDLVWQKDSDYELDSITEGTPRQETDRDIERLVPKNQFQLIQIEKDAHIKLIVMGVSQESKDELICTGNCFIDFSLLTETN